jgi:16S rRNA (cytidine1402-2'-O)-methyltransferase
MESDVLPIHESVNNGKLYLIPNVIAEGTQRDVICDQIRMVLPDIRYFLAENVRTARRFLSSLKIYDNIESLHFEILDKDTARAALPAMFLPVVEGKSIGVISESGCPGVADPGAVAVEYAHQHGIQVVPLVGPSSILLGLMASGLNGQRFAFHGYLPIDARELTRSLREYERESQQKSQTQIFIETPYRNNQLMSALLKTLHDSTKLTIALGLTTKEEWILTRAVSEWKKIPFKFEKVPAIFLFLAG